MLYIRLSAERSTRNRNERSAFSLFCLRRRMATLYRQTASWNGVVRAFCVSPIAVTIGADDLRLVPDQSDVRQSRLIPSADAAGTRGRGDSVIARCTSIRSIQASSRS